MTDDEIRLTAAMACDDVEFVTLPAVNDHPAEWGVDWGTADSVEFCHYAGAPSLPALRERIPMRPRPVAFMPLPANLMQWALTGNAVDPYRAEKRRKRRVRMACKRRRGFA
jgi:hypothetical protein